MKNTLFKQIGTLVLAGLALTAMPTQAEAQPKVIRIGVAAPTVGNPPLFTLGSFGIAYTKGWFEEEFKKDGVKLEWTYFKGAGPAVNEALTNHQLDFALQGDLPSVIGRSSGLKTRLIAAATVRTNIYLATPPDSSIKSIKDLKGKRVAIFLGTNMQLVVDRILAANGLSERDLRVVNLDTGSLDAAIATKSVDAAFSFIDLLSLRDKGLAKIVYTNRGSDPTFTRQNALLVTDEFASQYPAATTRVVKALARGAHWVSQEANQPETFLLWSKMGFAESLLREDLSAEPLKAVQSPLLDAFFVSRYKDVAAASYQLKLARNKVEVDSWVDRRYLTEALKQLQLDGFWSPVDAAGKPVTTVASGK
ncbi:ABC transporter substrate-binding protein [Andreprevotia chitinilytica]|uniref:ABC transporter substrate-binding protein n=1 Tax=Andreprevotia chitinilytica TaxID=396808 RepID=UPI0005574E4B|nr:ABC transporter substrate-binding protein [Andreprevotia chitinilytica]